MTKALVLGGGGLAGIGWELGVLQGWADEGVGVGDVGLVVGTSAGATVAAQLTSDVPLAALYERQHEPVESSAERAMELDLVTLTEIFTELAGVASDADRTAVLVRVGALALAAETPSESERLDIVRSRLPSLDWPAGRVLLTAVDVHTGEFVTFDRSSGVALLDAVAASCAVPGVWPPVTIGDRRFMDGGARSPTSADLAVGCDRVLVLAPMGAVGPVIDEEMARLEADGAAVLVVRPDADATAAFGPNPLDPACRAPSAAAGRRQGAATADEVRAFWSPPA